jgi:predicted dienelactone hydrolase
VRPRARRLVRVLVRVLALPVALVVLTSLGYGVLVDVRHERPAPLPAPAGPHPVGRAMVTWTDHSRPDTGTRERAGRELSVWLWYPAAPGSGHRAPYLPGAWRGLHLPGPVGLGESDVDAVRAHELDAAAVAPGRFPLVVLLPGLGFAAPQYTATAVDLASRGYLVAGVTPTGSANLTVLHGREVHATRAGNPSGFEGGHSRAASRFAERLLGVWAADARFAVARARRLRGRFRGHLSGGRVAYVGHSFGGAAALQACRDDQRCAGAVDLDGAQYGTVLTSGLHAPLLLVGHDGSCVTGVCRPSDAGDRADRDVARRLLDRSAGPSWSLELDDTEHFDFTDYSAYYLARPLHLLLAVGSLPRGRALATSDAYVAAFLRVAEGHAVPPLLAGPTTSYPEAHLRRQR